MVGQSVSANVRQDVDSKVAANAVRCLVEGGDGVFNSIDETVGFRGGKLAMGIVICGMAPLLGISEHLAKNPDGCGKPAAEAGAA